MIRPMRISCRVALCVVALIGAVSGAWASVVGAEQPITPTFGAAAGSQDNVSIAASPTGYLAVWQDSRGTNGTDIFGCRISLTGQVLDIMSIPICAQPSDQLDPAVAWDGQNYFVVWADRRDPAQHIYGCRVTPGGLVLDPQGMLVSGTTGAQSYPRAAGDGTGTLVVWQDERGTSPDIYCCKVAANGVIGKSYGISTRVDNEETPDVAFNGSVFFVAWRDYRNVVSTDTDIYGIRVSKTGVRSGSEVLVSCTTAGTVGAASVQRLPRVAAAGSSWMVVWEDLRTDSLTSDIYGCRIGSTGAVTDKGGIGICKLTGNQDSPSVCFDGSKLLVAWRNGSDRRIKGTRLTTSGGILDANGINISAAAAGASGCALGGANSSFVACWSTLSATASDCLFTPVSDSGVAQTSAGVVLSMSLDSQQDYAVADNGSEYAVVWSQLVNGSRDIVGARVSKSGKILSAVPINLTSTFAGEQTQPAIAWNGSKYLLVWRGNEAYSVSDLDIRGRFLDSTMTPIGTSATIICPATEDQSRPTVATNKSGFLVAWEDKRNAVSPDYVCDIYGALVSSTGTVTPITSAICLGANNQLLPKAASDGTNYFVVWEDYRTGVPLIKGSRVTSTGQVQDATTGVTFPSTSSNQTTPSVCYGNGSYFVAWSDYSKISGCRVSSAGAVLDIKGITINSGTKRKQSPGVCWDGQKYQVVWEDYRSADSANSDLYSTTISSTGVVASYPETALISDLAPQFRPCIFGSGGFGALFFSTYFNYVYGTRVVTLEDRAVQDVGKIVAAKQLPAGSMVALEGKVVSAVFPGCFYIQETDRSSGIKVVSEMTTAVGNLVDVVGTVSVADGERQINSGEAVAMGVAGDGALRPLGIRGDMLGGGWLNDQTPGITGAVGLNNIGLLVTTWGKVVSIGVKCFYIEGQPGVNIKVVSGALAQPAVGKMVVITGISSCEIVSGSVCRAILPRQQADIRVVN